MDQQSDNNKSGSSSILSGSKYSNERAEARKNLRQQGGELQKEELSGFEKIYRSAAASLAESSQSKKGIEGVTKPQLNEEQRNARQKQDSIDRRVLREFKRSAVTGKTSSWLRRYSEQKNAEFNSQNAANQQSEKPSSSISYSSSGNSSSSVKGSSLQGASLSSASISTTPYSSLSPSTMSTSSVFFDL